MEIILFHVIVQIHMDSPGLWVTLVCTSLPFGLPHGRIGKRKVMAKDVVVTRDLYASFLLPSHLSKLTTWPKLGTREAGKCIL